MSGIPERVWKLKLPCHVDNAIMKHKMPLPVVEEILASHQKFYEWDDLSPDSTRIRCMVDMGSEIEFLEELKNFEWQELREIREEREKKWKEWKEKEWKEGRFRL